MLETFGAENGTDDEVREEDYRVRGCISCRYSLINRSITPDNR
jgi:hypothetical protein